MTRGVWVSEDMVVDQGYTDKVYKGGKTASSSGEPGWHSGLRLGLVERCSGVRIPLGSLDFFFFPLSKFF